MSGRTFLDTNVLVYAVDADHPRRQERALEILLDAGAEHVLSTQVLMEFYVTVTRKLVRPLPEAQATTRVQELSTLHVVMPDASMVHRALKMSRKHSIPPWDALIVRSAMESQCSTLLTEDLQHGQGFGNLRVVNPFR